MPVRAIAKPLIFALAIALAGPGIAQQVQPSSVGDAVRVAQEAVVREDCAGALAALDPVVSGLAQTDPQRVIVQRMRLLCLGAVGRTDELPGVQRELAAALPRDGLIKAFGALIAADENRYTDAAEQIAQIAETSPRALEILTGTAIREIALRLSAEKADAARARMIIALVQADWQPSDHPELRGAFIADAIESLVKQGQPDQAEALLDRVDHPETLSAMVVDRHYAKIWPAIEALLGPASGASVDRFARSKLTLFGDSPDSETALRDAANAMLLLGRYQDVVDMTDDVRTGDEMSREAVMTLLFRARALAALRQTAEVDKLLGSFRSVDLRAVPTATTVLVTYAEFLDENGRPAEALTVTRDARSRGDALLSNAGKRWLDRTEVCALSALGRTAEAGRAMEALKQVADQNRPAAIEALLCARRDAEASQLAVKAFAATDVGADLLLQFQPAGSLWAPAPSRLRNLWTAFLSRPEIKAAFERNGRILPRGYWPTPGPRPIPRRSLAGETLV